MTVPADAKLISPGVYQLGDTLHLEVEELLEASGFAATPTNVRKLADAAREMAIEHGLIVREVEE